MLLHEKYAHLESPEELLPLALKIVRFKLMSLRRKSVAAGRVPFGFDYRYPVAGSGARSGGIAGTEGNAGTAGAGHARSCRSVAASCCA